MKLFRIILVSLSILALLFAIYHVGVRFRSFYASDNTTVNPVTNYSKRPTGSVKSEQKKRAKSIESSTKKRQTSEQHNNNPSKHEAESSRDEEQPKSTLADYSSYREQSARTPEEQEEGRRQLKKIETTWESEEYDEEWTLQVEDYLENQFDKAKINALKNDVSCKERLCRAKITFESPATATRLYRLPDIRYIDEPFVKVDYEKDGTINVFLYFPKQGIKMKDIYQ